MLRNKSGLISLIIICLLLTVGCTAKSIDRDTKILRILVDDVFDVVEELQESLFQYYEVKFPDVELQLIRRSEWSQLMKPGEDNFYIWLDNRYSLLKNGLKTPVYPDIVLLNDKELLFLAEEELLYPLEPFVHKNNFDLGNVGSAVREGIRDIGNGTLYALTPYFYAKALFYNKDFFDKRGLPYPYEGMSHQELIKLAKELAYEEDGVKYFGITFSSGHSSLLSYLFSSYIKTIGLSYLDEDNQVAVNTPEWEKVWMEFVDLHNSGTVPSRFYFSENDIPSFNNGRIAMTFGDRRDVLALVNQQLENQQSHSFQWDIISIPSSYEYPDRSALSSFGGYFMAININAENPELAWEFISFFNGEEFARLEANEHSSRFVSRPNAYNDQINGVPLNLSAFYERKPLPTVIQDEKQSKLDNLETWIMNVGLLEFEKVMYGNKDSMEALQDFQNIAERKLEEWKVELGIDWD